MARRTEGMPPNNRDAERALLGTMLRDPSTVPAVMRLIRASDYYTFAHQKIHAAIVELYLRQSGVDVLTVAHAIAAAGLMKEIGGEAYLGDVHDAGPAAANFEQYASIVRQHAERRELIQLSRKIEFGALDLADAPANVRQVAQHRLSEIGAASTPESAPKSWEPTVLSQLEDDGPLTWLWKGFVALHGITLFSALMKAGKTTLLTHLIRAMGDGRPMCGHDVSRGTVLYISEESASRWIARRDALGIGDHVHVVARPFVRKPSSGDWQRFLRHVEQRAKKIGAALVVLDTLSALWPVREENDAGAVQEALMPLWNLTGQSAVLLVHHLRKGDGAEGTGARGSGALLAFVDTILELRRDDANNRDSCRRRITGYGRNEGTPGEVVIELTNAEYRLIGSPKAARRETIQAAIHGILPVGAPGMTCKEIVDHWPHETTPTKMDMLDALNEATNRGAWQREGTGRKGSPHRYFHDAGAGG